MIWIARFFGLVDAALGVFLSAILIGELSQGDVSGWLAVFVTVLAVLPLLAFAGTIWPRPALVTCQLVTTALLFAAVLPTALSIGPILLLLACLSFLTMLFTVAEVAGRERRGDAYWREHARHPGWARYDR